MAAQRVRDFLSQNGVDYTVRTHERAVTAQEVAAAEHESGWHIAKPVLLMADGALVMVVVPAPYRVDLSRAAKALGAREVRLAEEREFGSRFDDCETGAEPIFGNLYEVPVLVDERLAGEERIRFAAGTHTETLEVATRDFLALVEPRRDSVGVRRD